MRRRRALLTIGALLLCVIATAFALFADRLLPRTPLKVARVVSALAIPSDAQILRFDDEWNNFNGDGMSLVVLQVTRDEMVALMAEASLKGFTRLTSVDSLPDALVRALDRQIDGVQKLDRDRSSISVTVLDSIGARVYVLLEIT